MKKGAFGCEGASFVSVVLKDSPFHKDHWEEVEVLEVPCKGASGSLLLSAKELKSSCGVAATRAWASWKGVSSVCMQRGHVHSSVRLATQ
jgi:hypothetical protein